MPQLVLLAIGDQEVDVLTRVRQNEDLRLSAVFHPDRNSMVARLAGLMGATVVEDLGALKEMSFDLCIDGTSGEGALKEFTRQLASEGRPVPVLVPVDHLDDYLSDPLHYRGVTRRADIPPVMPPRGTAPPEEEPGAIAVEAEASAESAGEPSAAPAAEPPAAAAPAAGEPAAVSPAATESMEAGPVEPRHEPPPAGHPVPQPPVIVSAPTPAPAAPGTLGAPAIELFYDPRRLAEWLAGSALRVAAASAAVVWRREDEGSRFSLAAFSPSSQALPTVVFSPAQLEAYVEAGRVQEQTAERAPLTPGASQPFHFLAVPLAGETAPFGLLGLFRPLDAGPFPAAAARELERSGREFGPALDRCFRFSQMAGEIRLLRFKEKVRDVMLEPSVPEGERWQKLLSFVLERLTADVARYFALADDGRHLSLVATASRGEGFDGWYVVPTGRGLLGAAFARGQLVIYSSDAGGEGSDLYLVPIRARKDGAEFLVGLLQLEGCTAVSPDGEDTIRQLLDLIEILKPVMGVPAGAEPA